MICELPNEALKFVLWIFNAILRIGIFSSSWKVPGKDISLVTSYRPISLLSILSKLFEKIFSDIISTYIETHQIIPMHQFGFRKKHSTTEQVHRIVTLIRKTFEDKQYCSALFIDISQAFDRVWHDGLILKICTLLPPNSHKLLKCYLTNRSFIVKSKNYSSNSRKISAGVPQGSI